MDFQGFGKIPGAVEGNAQVLPPIQGNMQILPTITANGYEQGANSVLQETAGLSGPIDANGFYGATTNTKDIFGDTLKTQTETTEFHTTTPMFGENQFIQNVDTNTFFGTTGVSSTSNDSNIIFGATQVIPGTSEQNAIFANQTLAGTQFLPPTATTDTNAFYGTTLGTQVGGITNNIKTTTTQTAYNTTSGFGTFAATAQKTYGVNDGGLATQNEYPATGITTPDAQIGYGTTAADLIPTQPTYSTENTLPTTYEIPTTSTQTTTQTTYGNAVEQQATTVAVESQPVETQFQSIPQNTTVTQTVQTTQTPVATQNQIIQNTPQVLSQPRIIQQAQQIPNAYGARILDEDFRRGRPIYNNTRTYAWKNNNNLPIRPSYNVDNTLNSRILNYGYNNTGFGHNRLAKGLTNTNALGTGLSKLGRGGSYDVYSKGINPLLNKAGLGQANNVVTSNIKDFL